MRERSVFVIVKTLSVALLLIASCVLTARGQQVINVQFGDGGDTPLNGTAWSSTISPLSYSGTIWSEDYNYGNFGQTDLPYSNTGSSTVGYTLTGPSNLANNDTFATLPILQEIEYSYSGPLTLTISGLQNGQAYNLALDCAFNYADGSTFSITGSSPQSDTGANASSFINGVNYVDFDSVVASDNEIVVTISANGTGQDFANLNGFQIEVAPEPSTWAMLFGGLGMLAFFVRRKLTA